MVSTSQSAKPADARLTAPAWTRIATSLSRRWHTDDGTGKGTGAQRGAGGRFGEDDHPGRWRRNRPWRAGRLGRAVPLITGAVLALLLALTAVLVGRWQLGNAEHGRRANRVDLVESIANYRSQTDDPATLQTMVDGAGFSLTDPAHDADLLAAFDLTPTGNPTVAVALLDTSGRVIAARPDGAAIPTAQLGSAWGDALRGEPGWSSAFDVDGQEVRAGLAPIHAGGSPTEGFAAGKGEPRAVLVSLSIDTAGERFQERLGVLGNGAGAGGLSQVDRDGVAISSWAPTEVGRRIVDPARLTDLRPGHSEVWQTRGADGHERTVIAAAQLTTGYVTVFEASNEQLYGDLRDQQASRNHTLVGVLGGSVFGLVLFGALRELGARRARARLHNLLGNTHDVIVLVRDGSTVVFMSPSARRLLGQADAEWVDRPLLDLVHPDDRDRVAASLACLSPGETTLVDVRLRATNGAEHGSAPVDDTGAEPATGAEAASGAEAATDTDPEHFRWFDLTAVDERGAHDLGGVVITCHEVGERKALQDRLAHKARHDPLTGLPNRATFLAHLAGALTTSAVDGTRDALLFIDLDDFKPINDRHGHAVGDHVLRVVAQRIVATLRPDDLACRFGGDEFGALLREAEPATARLIAERLATAIARPISLPPPDTGAGAASAHQADRVQVRASIGVALSTPSLDGHASPADADALLRAADQAMYEAKRAGHGPRTVFAPDLAPITGPAAALSEAAAAAIQPSPRAGSAPPSAPSARPATVSRRAAAGAAETAPATAGPAPRDDASARGGGPRRAAAGRARLAAPMAGRRRRAWPRWLRSLVPILAVAALLLGILGIGLRQEADAQRTARAAALAQNRAVAAAFNDSAATILEPGRLVPLVSAAPWTFTNPTIDREILRRFAASAIGGPDTDLLLTSPDGQILSALPAKATMPVDTRGTLWRSVVAGQAQWTPVTADSTGTERVYGLEPVIRDGRTVAVLAIGRSAHHGLPTVIFQSLASLGSLELVDQNGRVGFGSDNTFIGRRVVDPATLSRLSPEGEATSVRSADPGLISLAMPTGRIPGYYTLLQRDRTAVFDDLGSSLPGLGLLLGIVAFTLIAVAASDDRRRRVLRRDVDRFEALLRGAHDIVAVAAPDGRISVVGPSVTRLLDQRTTDWAGHDVADLAHPDDAARLRAFVRATAGRLPPPPPPTGAPASPRAPAASPPSAAAPSPAAGAGRPGPETLQDVRLRTADGRHRWFDVTASALTTAPGSDVSGVLITCHDIGERKALQDELTAAAYRDPLTGLPNRVAFDRCLDEAVLRAARRCAERPDGHDLAAGGSGPEAGSGVPTASAGASPSRCAWETGASPFGVLFVDLDNFKPVNDIYGHGTGDEVLEIVALRLEATVRAGDTVARLGGDEFGILVANTDEGELVELAERILAALRQPLRTKVAVLTVAATIGAALSTAYPDPLRIIRAADLAMYDAKRRGRGSAVLAGADGRAPRRRDR
ncbi:diguanylate cyclase domain-containing protein [Pseudofrankia sp. BMG5.37]|uniref:diguanylate cyclase domain-containing protein n=1 Tax=Pseudofrankia sp. BMG5.37 TaxID=3050035 RepID=UPI0028947DC4|nr:diguanylate cyclase [Pseudofrankia sp. BMG5.37]MDT3438078.1 diguanylate cyclase [Pseudofrankia sp. BMG5.37]